jgi:cell division initiation protein
MAFTPVELRHVSIPRRRLFGGYRIPYVDRLVLDVADSFEDVWRERADLLDKVEQLDSELARHRELETLLRTTLVSAERTAHELKDQAKRQSQLILDEAHGEARAITRDAASERERLVDESRRIRTLLRAALETLEEPRPRALGNGDAAEAEAA